MNSVKVAVVGIAFVTLGASLAAGQAISNPSFEEDGFISSITQQDPTGWTVEIPSSFGGAVPAQYATDGSYSLMLYNRFNGTFLTGDFVSVWQEVDLTEITSIAFDAYLDSSMGAIFAPDFEAKVLVDGVEYWTQSAADNYLDQWILVSDLSGVHRLDLRLECVRNLPFIPWVENRATWDNLRLIPEPATLLLLGFGAFLIRRRN